MEGQIQNYLKIFPNEENSLYLLQKQISENQDIYNRKNFEGHITASGLVISPDKKILVIFNKNLNKFLQPGGHTELGDLDLICSAIREVKEETGLKNISLSNWCKDNNSPIMIDTHKISENIKKNEPEHHHHDFMFIFESKETDITLDTNEVSDFCWKSIEEIINDDSVVAKGLNKAIILGII